MPRTDDRPSRRTLIRLGAGSALAGALPPGIPAAGAARLSARGFDRGVNAWPWFSFPVAFPPAGAYPAIPPFHPGRPVPRYEDLAKLAAAGFDFIRLPVCPAPFLHLASTGQERQLRRCIEAVTEAVALAHSAGLGTVVNLQPDSTPGYTAEELYGSTAAMFDAYRRLVSRFAGSLAALPIERLAFEPVNEPPQSAADDWAARQDILLAAARASAARLKLVATGAFGGSIRGLVRLDPRALVRSFDPLLFTFHFYEPYLFSHQGAPWLARSEPKYAWLNNLPWPGSAGSLSRTMASVRERMTAFPNGHSQARLRAYEETIRSGLEPYFNPPIDSGYFTGDPGNGGEFFTVLRGWATGHGLGPERILMGEFGALQTTEVARPVTGGPYVAANAADRARYLADLRRTAEDHGYGWAMWTLFNPGMGLMDETSRALDPAVLGALGLAVSR